MLVSVLILQVVMIQNRFKFKQQQKKPNKTGSDCKKMSKQWYH